MICVRDVSLRRAGGMCGYVRPGHREAGWFVDASTAIRKVVGIPVMLTGGVKTADDAERAGDAKKAIYQATRVDLVIDRADGIVG